MLVFQYLGWYVEAFFTGLPPLLWRAVIAWLLSFVVLAYGFNFLKPRVRRYAMKFDDAASQWGRKLRYRDPENVQGQRVWLTWFFRFWTNFASSPTLIALSILIPVWFGFVRTWSRREFISVQAVRSEISDAVGLWLIPGVCYAGALLLSYVLKRVFRRLRPPRVEGAFGHKLKDPSFPSGHSLTAFCFWGMLTMSMLNARISTPGTVLFATIAAAIIILTGMSRVYLGVHFASDVAGGFLIGLIWCIFCYLALSSVL